MGREVGKIWDELRKDKEYDQNILKKNFPNKILNKKIPIKWWIIVHSVFLRFNLIIRVTHHWLYYTISANCSVPLNSADISELCES